MINNIFSIYVFFAFSFCSILFAGDLDSLQGTWMATSIEVEGVKFEGEEAAKQNRNITLQGKKYIETWKLSDRDLFIKGEFSIDDNGNFDILAKTNFGKEINFIGIYKLEGENLKLCIKANLDQNAKRPTSFEPDPEKTNWCIVYDLVKKKQ